MAYEPTDWYTGDIVTASRMNKIEAGIEQNSLGVEGNASELATARATVAPNFLTTKAYAVGDYVYYNDALYRFTSAHAAGAWVGTDATQVVMGDDLTDLKSGLTFNYDTTNKMIVLTFPE